MDSPSSPPGLSFDSVHETERASLEEDIELDLDARNRILRTYRDLNHQDHYALLGVDRTADRQAIKRAYNAAALLYHPDRYFRKRLGSFKSRLEAIFSRVSLAIEALSDPVRRSEYDAYLSERDRTQDIERALSNTEIEVERILAETEVESKIEASNLSSQSRPSSAPEPAANDSAFVDTASRRDAFSRRLLGGRGRTSTLPPSSPPSEPSPRR